jgi:hypothetical protein
VQAEGKLGPSAVVKRREWMQTRGWDGAQRIWWPVGHEKEEVVDQLDNNNGGISE